jgi:NDP-sugar pyrophosphorylase family protein
MQALVLAGGLGTRMLPATGSIPKALLPVAGIPFAGWQTQLLAAEGVNEIVYGVGHLGSQIEHFIGDGSQWGVSVRYSYEYDRLLGTGGAIRLAIDRGLLQSSFFVLYGDSYLPIRYREVASVFANCGYPALMTVYPNHDRWEKSNVWYTDGMVRLYDKGGRSGQTTLTYVDYGLSILTRDAVIEYIPPATVHDLADTFQTLSVAGRLAGYVAPHRFYEIGTPSGLKDLEAYLAGQSSDAQLEGEDG